MVKYYDSIQPELADWALKQAVFFTSSAPLYGRHINLSPKGLPATSFSILSPNLCGYVDATGSGIETVSHILENGRVTIMFCSFETSPRIMRFFCTGRVVEWNEPGFEGWLKRMGGKKLTGMRAVIVLDVFKVSLCRVPRRRAAWPMVDLSGAASPASASAQACRLLSLSRSLRPMLTVCRSRHHVVTPFQCSPCGPIPTTPQSKSHISTTEIR